MTAHNHATFVPGCSRCDLSRDEMTADRIETAEALDAIVPALIRVGFSLSDSALAASVVLDALRKTAVPAAGLRVTRETVASARWEADIAGTPTMDEQAWCTAFLAALGVPVVDGEATRESEASHAALCDVDEVQS